MTHHEDRCCSWLIIGWFQHASVKCRHTQEFKCAGGDVRSIKHLAAFSVLVEDGIISSGHDGVKHMVLIGKFEEFIGGVSLAAFFLRAGGIVNAQKDHAK